MVLTPDVLFRKAPIDCKYFVGYLCVVKLYFTVFPENSYEIFTDFPKSSEGSGSVDVLFKSFTGATNNCLKVTWELQTTF